MAMKKFRNMKVYEQSGYQYKSTPAIMLKGQWFWETGFDNQENLTVYYGVENAGELISARFAAIYFGYINGSGWMIWFRSSTSTVF